MLFIILFSMIFLHIVDDYYLQGILAKLKQRSWWQDNAPDKKYRYDYIIALIEHAFSWTFMILIPLTIYTVTNHIDCIHVLILLFIANIIIHAVVDHIKCNMLKINLTTDQIIHIVQIIVSWFIYCCIFVWN